MSISAETDTGYLYPDILFHIHSNIHLIINLLGYIILSCVNCYHNLHSLTRRYYIVHFYGKNEHISILRSQTTPLATNNVSSYGENSLRQYRGRRHTKEFPGQLA